MALVREQDYKGRQIKLTVSKSGLRYIGVVDIPGMALPAAQRQVDAETEEGAFRAARRRAEQLIDQPPQRSTAVPEY